MKSMSSTKEEIFKLAHESYGVVPGIIKEMAERSVPLSYLYLTGTQIMATSSLNDLEINAIELKISTLNKCESCTKGHSYLLKKAGLEETEIELITMNQATSNERLNRLLRAAEYIYFSGHDTYPDRVLDYFEQEELTEQEVFDIIGLISLKTISNFVNNYLKSVKARLNAAV